MQNPLLTHPSHRIFLLLFHTDPEDPQRVTDKTRKLIAKHFEKDIDFMGYRRYFLGVSALLAIASIVAFINPGPRFGTDASHSETIHQ